jgi:glycolate oxidase iron-sulfur subunit
MLTTEQIIAEADRCVACGLCLPVCPTYNKTGSEADSPRGRIQLMSAVARDILPANQRYQQHINLCLGCRNCETACPNGVQYGALIDSAKAAIAGLTNEKIHKVTVNTTENKQTQVHISPHVDAKVHFILNMLTKLASKPTAMRLLANVILFLQKSRIIKLAAFIPIFNKPIALLPTMPTQQKWQTHYKTSKSKKGDVSLFLGCISNAFDTDTLRASIFVLNQLGYDIFIPTAQTCCGSLARQQGNAALATMLIAQNQTAFGQSMPLLTVASGCGASLQDYATLEVMDICAFLMRCDWQTITVQPMADEIVIHEPCTLRNVQKTHLAVMALLQKIPQLKLSNLSGNTQCCGGAGAYMLNQPAMASSLLADKISAVQQTNAVILATTNIGCALHIAAGLRQQKMSVSVLHPVQIIAKQMGFNQKKGLE